MSRDTQTDRWLRALLLTALVVASVTAIPFASGLGSATAQAQIDGQNNLASTSIQTTDNETVYTASADTTVKALDAGDSSELWTFDGHSQTVRSVSPSPQGDVVYSGAEDETVKAIDATDGTEIWSFGGHTNSVTTVMPSPDGDVVYTGSLDDTVKALDASDGTVMWTFSGHTSSVYSVAPSPDGSTLYTGSSDDSVKAIDTSDGTGLWTFNGHGGTVRSVAVSPDGSEVYTASDDNTVKSVNAGDGTEIWSFAGHTGTSVRSVESSATGDTVYSGGTDDMVRAIYADNATEKWSYGGHSNLVHSISTSPNGGTVYSASQDTTVKSLNAPDGSEIWNYTGHSNSVLDVNAGGIYAGAFDQTTGEVIDEDGNGIVGATVTFRNIITGSETTTQTDSAGRFGASVGTGRYEIEISSVGYQTLTITRDIEEGEELGTFQLVPQKLDLQFNRFVEPGDSTPYTVEFTDENGTVTDVTANVSINSSNTSIATVNTEGAEIIGADGVNGTSEIAVNYTVNNQTYTDIRTVTVATKTVDNLEIIPGTWRLSALLDDITIQVILVAIGAAIIATRAASSWAGLGAMELVILIGWFGGWVPLGIALLGLFTALFIGLNLAANIDYSVRR